MATAIAMGVSLAGCVPVTELPPPVDSRAPSGSPAPAKETETPSRGPAAAKDASCPGDECIDVAVAGDILLHPALWEQAEGDGKGAMDFEPLLAGIAPYLDQSDLALCNLETPVAAEDGPYSGYPMFNVPPQIVPALAQVGYDGCTTASNHSMDGGVPGIKRTLDALDEAGLMSTGSYRSAAEAKKPLLAPVGSAKVAVIAGTYSLNGMAADAPWRVDGIEESSLLSRAKAARTAGADIVMAAIHDGAEYTSTPTAAQLNLYRALAESGEFDFIYSHHTHSVLPIEKHQGTWIVYGLGNSVAKHATKTVLNTEGLTVKMQFVRTGKTWKSGNLVWAAHTMAPAPLRWCALPSPSTRSCTTEVNDADSLKRTTKTVNSMNAEENGAKMWGNPGR